MWTHDSNHFGWFSLLGQEPGGEGVPPYAAAARAEDLAGLPSTYIWVIGAYAVVFGILLIILASRLRNLPRDDQALDASRASRV